MSSKRRRPEGREPVIRPFDFLRPNKLTREHVRSLSLVQETFTRGFATQLASVLRSVSQLSVTNIEQQTWDEYVRSVPSPCFGVLLNFGTLPGAGMLALPLDISYTIVELLMGGSSSVGGKYPDRALSEIESGLLRSFVERVLPELRVAFEPLWDIQPSILALESNPQFAQIAGPTDLVIVVNYDVLIDNVTSKATMCIPYTSLQEVLDSVSAQGNLANVQVDLVRARERVARRAEEVPVNVAARFQNRRMKSSEILALQPGDVIKLGVSVEEPLVLWAGGRPAYRVKPGKQGRRTAVEVLSPMLVDGRVLSDTSEKRGGTRR